MAKDNTLAGKLLGVRLGGQWVRCQTDATLTLTVNLSEEDPCKPDSVSSGANDDDWVRRTVDGRDWSLSFSAKSFQDDLELNGFDISDLIINNELDVDIEFATPQSQTKYPQDIIYSGTGIFASQTLNAPVTGASTYDIEISGNGPLSLDRIPVTT